ncbi:metallophosphoesterase family protein [Paenibacillus sp. Marseille-Q4541]|uniref:metallophosphoesterase family protein n=1 Tax=Paenibacillus sp. Marseille-Q4541 TaxID=2831522 RepID=UPI001BAC4A5E|nr:metallophosphoesterase family protein [Paenibacillus sp. Marseille-Q4541]
MRTLAISDIHGCYDQFNTMLEKVNYNPGSDKLILLGDYVDRGIKSRQVVEQVKSLREEHGVIALKGNHDQMFVDAMLKGEDELWLNNGAYQTVESYCGFDFFEEQFEWDTYEKAKAFILKHYEHHIEFLDSLPYYHETDNYIFAHAGINPFYSTWEHTPDDDFLWIRSIFYKNKITNTDNKKVVFGHTPTSYLQESDGIWFSPDGDKIGIDGACAYGRRLNCLEITEEGIYIEHTVKKGETRNV